MGTVLLGGGFPGVRTAASGLPGLLGPELRISLLLSASCFGGRAGCHHVLKYRIILNKSSLTMQLIHCNNFLQLLTCFLVPSDVSNSDHSLPPDILGFM